MGKKNNDGLAADAALAVEDTPERRLEQLHAVGGERDEIDDFDPSDLDDGSVLPEGFQPNPAPAESPDDDDTEDKDDDEDADKGSDSEGDDTGEDEDDASEDDDSESGEDESEDTDADDESEDEDDPADKPASKGIPKRRFDEVNEEKKTLREENARLKAQIEAAKPPTEDDPEPYDIKAGELAYMELLLDGDTEAALAKREEIDVAKEAKWASQTSASTQTEIKSEAEHTELLALSAEAQEMFDVFNPDHEDYNQGMLNKVMTFMRGYLADKVPGPDAFVAAIADVADMYDLMPVAEGTTEKEDASKPKPTGKKKVDKRKKKLAEDAVQPVGSEGSGSTESGVVAPDVETMTDEEFDALPEAAQARLRGDIL